MDTTVDTSNLVALAVNKSTTYNYDKPDASLLESFECPMPGSFPLSGQISSIHIEVPEFTSLCPLTGQPDFATIVIDYTPRNKCVESKSLKLYLMSFRNHGEFHESCVARIFGDLHELLDPKKLVVEGRFTPRGGIPFWPKISFDNWD